MRNAILTTTIFALLHHHALSQSTIPFQSPFQPLLNPPLSSSSSSSEQESNTTLSTSPLRFALPFLLLSKRAATKCASGYASCDYMGYTGYCCATSAQCAIDPVGHIACCPKSAVCTGTVIGGNFATVLAPAASSSSAVTASPAVSASFVQGVDGSSSSLSTTTITASINSNSAGILQNPYYPYPIIPTTYANAVSCSLAYSACQTDLSSCTAFLAQKTQSTAATAALTNGLPVVSVTISAPNFSGTGSSSGSSSSLSASTTYAMLTAQAICSSLSSLACSGLQVSACTVFNGGVGNAAAPRETGLGVGAIVAAAGGLFLL